MNKKNKKKINGSRKLCDQILYKGRINSLNNSYIICAQLFFGSFGVMAMRVGRPHRLDFF